MISLNFIGTALLAVVLANLFISAAANAPLAPEVHVMTPPISVGKERSFSSGRDASMFTQQVRRRAVVNAHYGSPGYILRETPHTSGFTNGVVELYSLTGVCERICAAAIAACEPILDGGKSTDEFCDVLDGGSAGGSGDVVLDAGNSQTVVLALGEPSVVTDTGQMKIGDGIHTWNDLPYVGSSASIIFDGGGPFQTYSQGPVLDCGSIF